MFGLLASAIDACWDDIAVTFAEPWEIPFTVRAGERDDYEIYLLERGSGRFTVDGREFPVGRGSVTLLRTNVENSFAPDGGEGFRFVFVTFAVTRGRPERDALDAALAGGGAAVFTPADDAAARGLLYSMQKVFFLKSPGYMFEMKLLLGSLSLELSRRYSESAAPDDNTAAFNRNAAVYINEILAYLQDNHSRQITLGELGRVVNLHPRYLCSLFSRASGRTIWATLREIRLERAKRLLLNTALSVTEIALETGFGDSQYFSRVFSAAEGRSPTAYRKAVRTARS